VRKWDYARPWLLATLYFGHWAGRRGRLLHRLPHSHGQLTDLRDLQFYCTSTCHIQVNAGFDSSTALTIYLYNVALSGSPLGLKGDMQRFFTKLMKK